MNSKKNCVFWYNYFKIVSPNLLITWKKTCFVSETMQNSWKSTTSWYNVISHKSCSFLQMSCHRNAKFSCQFHYNKLSDLKYWVFLSLFSFTESYCLHCCFYKYVSPSERFIGRTPILPLEYSFLINFQIISLNWIRIYRTRMEKLMAS